MRKILYLFLRSQILELVEYDNEGAVMTRRICTGLKELFRVWPRKGFSMPTRRIRSGNEAAGIYRGSCFKRLPLYQCPLHGESSRGSSCGQRIFQVPLYQTFKQYMNMTFYEYLNSKRVKRAESFCMTKDEYHGCGDAEFGFAS